MDEKDKRISELETALSAALARLSELERRLNLNSKNSGKPPSSDGYKKPSPKSQRVKGQKKVGGQTGHKGSTARQIETTQETINHVIEQCPCCATDLSGVNSFKKKIKRQVIEITEPELHVTDHIGEVKQCPNCRKKVSAVFPEGVNAPVQYGASVRSVASYFLNNHLVPVARTRQIFADVYGLLISPASLQSFDENLYRRLASWENDARQEINQANVKQSDETGFRVIGKLHWLHSLSTLKATVYRVSDKRGSMPVGLEGTLIHDHWMPYYGIAGVAHGLCNAHHLRELQSLMDEKEFWAFQMHRLLRVSSHLKNTKTPEELTALVQRLERRYDHIVKMAIAFHEGKEPLPQKKRGKMKRRPGHNLALRLRDYKEDVLRFLHHGDVPFTNNLAEQDIRMMKLKQKISGCFRSLEGAAIFARIRSYISTSRKQGEHILSALKIAFSMPLPTDWLPA
jgi:transposase